MKENATGCHLNAALEWEFSNIEMVDVAGRSVNPCYISLSFKLTAESHSPHCPGPQCGLTDTLWILSVTADLT